MREGEIPVFYGEITNEGRQLPPFVCSDCRKTPICKQVGVKFMPNYAFAQKSRSITAKNEKNMCFLQLWIAYFLRFIAANLSLTQFVT